MAVGSDMLESVIMETEIYLLQPRERFPNNPRLPLILYRQAIDTAKDPAGMVEARFHVNGWAGTWRNGVYPFHHYHSNAHEVLGVAIGRATIQFGGPGGPEVTVHAGDVAILPAGTSHKRSDASRDFLVVGGYPEGQADYDLVRGGMDEAVARARIAAVPLPAMDPVFGADGPMLHHWQAP